MSFLLKLVINHSWYSVDGLSWVVRLDDVFMYMEALLNIRLQNLYGASQ